MGYSVGQVCRTLSQPFFSEITVKNLCEDSGVNLTHLFLAGVGLGVTGFVTKRIYDHTKRPTLTHAARLGLLNDVRLIISKRGNVNEKDPQTGNTALHFAIVNGHMGVVNALLNAEVDLAAVNLKGETALHFACQIKDPDLVRQLAEKGADVNAKDQNGNTPLMCAVNKGHLETVQALLESEGLQINAQNLKLETALALASREYFQILVALLDKKADANIPDNKGQLPLHRAVFQENVEAIAELVKSTDNPNQKDDDGNTPLHLTVHHVSSRLKSAEELLKCEGVNPNVLNKEGESPLHAASVQMTGNNDLALLFIKSGRFNLDLVTEDQENTAAHIALEANNQEVLKALIKAGAKMDIANKEGKRVIDADDEKWSLIYGNRSAEELRELTIEGLSAIEWATIHCCPSFEKVLNAHDIYFTYPKECRKRLVDKCLQSIGVKIQQFCQKHIPIRIKEIRELFEDIEELTKSDFQDIPLQQPELIQLCRSHIDSILKQRAIVAEHKKAKTHVFGGDLLIGSGYGVGWYYQLIKEFLPEKLKKMTKGLDRFDWNELIRKLPVILQVSLMREISLRDIEKHLPLLRSLLNAYTPDDGEDD